VLLAHSCGHFSSHVCRRLEVLSASWSGLRASCIIARSHLIPDVPNGRPADLRAHPSQRAARRATRHAYFQCSEPRAADSGLFRLLYVESETAGAPQTPRPHLDLVRSGIVIDRSASHAFGRDDEMLRNLLSTSPRFTIFLHRVRGSERERGAVILQPSYDTEIQSRMDMWEGEIYFLQICSNRPEHAMTSWTDAILREHWPKTSHRSIQRSDSDQAIKRVLAGPRLPCTRQTHHRL
jgi:hypothetical protein